MTGLSAFTAEDIRLLVTLPYRAGVWVSHAEDEDGDVDDVREIRALESCIRAVARLHADQSLVGAIIAETLIRREEWNEWAAHCFDVPGDARKAMAALKGKATETELTNYHAMVMEIASAVAQAHGEFGDFGDADEGLLSGLISRIVDRFATFSPGDAGHPMNVSAAEDSALAALSKALQN